MLSPQFLVLPNSSDGSESYAAADQEIYATLGWIDRPVDLDGVIDQRFARQAVEALGGPYNRD